MENSEKKLISPASCGKTNRNEDRKTVILFGLTIRYLQNGSTWCVQRIEVGDHRSTIFLWQVVPRGPLVILTELWKNPSCSTVQRLNPLFQWAIFTSSVSHYQRVSWFDVHLVVIPLIYSCGIMVKYTGIAHHDHPKWCPIEIAKLVNIWWNIRFNFTCRRLVDLSSYLWALPTNIEGSSTTFLRSMADLWWIYVLPLFLMVNDG